MSFNENVPSLQSFQTIRVKSIVISLNQRIQGNIKIKNNSGKFRDQSVFEIVQFFYDY